MILFYGEGRLGNQMFQYQALSQFAKPGERVFAIGLEDLEESLELHGPRLSIVTRNGLLKRFVKYVVNPVILRPLAKRLRVISYVSERSEGEPPHNGASGLISMRVGLFRRITFVDGGHYQNASLWTDIFPTSLFRVNRQLQLAATQYLEAKCGIQCRPAFVHVRRGDYLGFATYGLSDVSLPTTFYINAIHELERRVGKTHVIFVTDDPAWVEVHFRNVLDKSVASFSAAMDFAIMTECRSGILSNSTFSLAAAFLLKAPEIVIAPDFWFGFRIRKWLPPRIKVQHSKFIYLSVPPESTNP